MEWINDPNGWIALGVLTGMEIVLGIDNVIFISILAGRLPPEDQPRARRIGLAVALLSRIALLFAISWVMKLTEPLFDLFGRGWSGKDLILLFGGLFLIWKATREIYENVEHPDGHKPPDTESAESGMSAEDKRKLMWSIVGQVVLLDVVFSLDSVITAVGMTDYIVIMIIAVLVSVGIMIAFAGPIGDFVQRHASVKVLALAFLVLIGVTLLIEGTGGHMNKGYIYAAMGFSVLIEMLNFRRRAKLKRPAEPKETG